MDSEFKKVDSDSAGFGFKMPGFGFGFKMLGFAHHCRKLTVKNMMKKCPNCILYTAFLVIKGFKGFSSLCPRAFTSEHLLNFIVISNSNREKY